jgi:DNA-binding NarL/FixJ family response regulator
MEIAMAAIDAGISRRRVRIMLVDDHEIVRQGIRSLIETIPEWTVCAEAADGQVALHLAEQVRPDVIVLDISLPKISGLDVLVDLKRMLPDAEILVLTMHDSERTIAQMLRAGCRGYLLKTETGEKLIEALTKVSRHQTYFSSSVSETLLQYYINSAEEHEHEQLTPRQRQIVKLVAEGNSNKRIAYILNISVKTVETHRLEAMRRIGAKSSADLALYAARNELIRL